ncbi:unnamed protein product [Paramecium pentaurelia]|uniref:Uncharacterized protein n=1 Tax=Paramecium pentaurelia TaxID=43138 RepID=A0A8S1WFP8_9CILI|nr:unnamed protein product [Paramecium pentaurelia]
MLDQIDESIDMTIKMQSLKPQNRSPEQKVSLLKLRKNSKSFVDYTTEKLITIYWYDQEHDQTYEFTQGFSEILRLGDISNWAILKLRDMNLPKIDIEQTKLYLPKKKQGKPNEDFPSFRNELQLKDCDQTKFSLKVTFLIRQVTPPQKIEPRSSYSNSLNKVKHIPIPEQQKKSKNRTNFFCFCNNGD